MLADTAAAHCSWFARGHDRVELDGVTVFLGPRDAIIAFPQPDADLASAVATARGPDVREISCWSLRPDDAPGRRLIELGFQDGWQPHWMGLDPRGAEGSSEWEVEETNVCSRNLPYASEQHERVLGGDVHHFVARDGETIVGHVVLDVDGERGGIFDMGVIPAARRRGFGRALTLAALAKAGALDCTSVTLNATGEGEPLYRSVGFESLGLGMTWWMFPRY